MLCLLAAGCGQALSCTLVDCVSQASISWYDRLPPAAYPLAVRACFDKRCADLTVGAVPPPAGGNPTVPCTGSGNLVCFDRRGDDGHVDVSFHQVPAGSAAHRVALVVRDAAGARVVRDTTTLVLTKLAPNGEKCGPVCWDGTASFR